MATWSIANGMMTTIDPPAARPTTLMPFGKGELGNPNQVIIVIYLFRAQAAARYETGKVEYLPLPAATGTADGVSSAALSF